MSGGVDMSLCSRNLASVSKVMFGVLAENPRTPPPIYLLVLSRMSDVIEIETWVQGDGRIGTRSDWILKDYSNGDINGRAKRKLVMMNEDTKRIQKVIDDVKEEYLFRVFGFHSILAFPEENSYSLKKITKLEDPVEYSRLGLVT
ncbi:unnamed protein product [Lactuca saligna]|uniref:Acyl-[acyl-carrier-protein] hydrolase n=1 Tax=Lactuca saligna TaxID=75948 RepID=A0AA35ZF94_LACSI|nr:unnamed protein product [Lactuca saligna]